VDLEAILTELRQERQWIDEAIVSFERLAGATPRKRGRPSKRMTTFKALERGRPGVRKNPPETAAQ